MYAFEEEKKECCGDCYHLEGSNVAPFKVAANEVEVEAHHVYYRSDDHGWIPARLRYIDEQIHEAIVTVDEYQTEQEMLQCGLDESYRVRIAVDLMLYPHGDLPLQNTSWNGELLEYEDMTDMPNCSEPSILYNLKLRHMKGKPYTRSGDVIISMNPYTWYPDLYQKNVQHRYARELLWDNLSTSLHCDSTMHTPKEIAPHVYETTTLAYKAMALWNKPQSILVSGESGAGKTETTKICIEHFAMLQRGLPQPDWQEQPTIEVERILISNPLLEAFGNAQTRRNDNSSRFGRHICLQFDRQTLSRKCFSPARLVGSISQVYFLEKNRVVSREAQEERTFHIFYQMLAAGDQVKTKIWRGLQGKIADSFSYVGNSRCFASEGRNDSECFNQTLEALHLVGFNRTDSMDLFRSLCVVLQLGNIGFAPDPTNDDKSIITSEKELDALASLMGLSARDLYRALTERTMVRAAEVYQVPLTAAAAKESADALAKSLYERVFLWLVQRINQATCAAKRDNVKQHRFGTISLLDIFGFEAYSVNRFEQLCINYANEKLQAKFTEDCFKVVEAEYKEQGIALASVPYEDNSDVLDLIEGRTGLLAMLNEECWRPQGNATTFVNKALRQNQRFPCLFANKMDPMSFGIHHYAGKVLYDANDFITCNQDRLPAALLECAANASNPIISNQYKDDAAKIQGEQAVEGPSSNSYIKAKTVWTKYKDQLTNLMADLHKTESRYIRCIKPNTQNEPLIVQHNFAIAQLRSCGIISSILWNRSAFPNRMDNKKVISRFGGIWRQGSDECTSIAKTKRVREEQCTWKAEAHALLSLALKCRNFQDPLTGEYYPAFIVGKTKTFFRAGALEQLEADRMLALDQQAIIIQRRYRSYVKQKPVILAARELRQRLANHRRMAELRRASKQAEEQARREAEAREEKEFEMRMAAEWEEFQARLAQDHREFLERLDEEDAKFQAQLDAETSAWQKKMEQESREFEERLEEERKLSKLSADNELAALQAEMSALRQRMREMDRECAEKVKTLEKGHRAALKQKLEYNVKEWQQAVGGYLCKKNLDDQIMFCGVMLEEREKQIKTLKWEGTRLAKILEKTEQTKTAIQESNKSLQMQCKDVRVNFNAVHRRSLSVNAVTDACLVACHAAKLENQVLRDKAAMEKEKLKVLTICKMDLQHTLTKILETVQCDCQDRDLRNCILKEIIRTAQSAHKHWK